MGISKSLKHATSYQFEVQGHLSGLDNSEVRRIRKWSSHKEKVKSLDWRSSKMTN